MASKMSSGGWVKMVTAGVVMCIGGPALVYYVSPTEDELRKKYNPELQKRSLENRDQRQREFDDFVGRLKEYSKSDKPIWQVQAEHEAQLKEQRKTEAVRIADEARKQQEEIKKQALSGK